MGNFIPKPYSTEQITIRIRNDVLEQVEAAAARYNLSRNAFVNQCIEYALANMDDSSEQSTD